MCSSRIENTACGLSYIDDEGQTGFDKPGGVQDAYYEGNNQDRQHSSYVETRTENGKPVNLVSSLQIVLILPPGVVIYTYQTEQVFDDRWQIFHTINFSGPDT